MPLVLSSLCLIVGVVVAGLSSSDRWDTAALEYWSGLLLTTGLMLLGAGLQAGRLWH